MLLNLNFDAVDVGCFGGDGVFVDVVAVVAVVDDVNDAGVVAAAAAWIPLSFPLDLHCCYERWSAAAMTTPKMTSTAGVVVVND